MAGPEGGPRVALVTGGSRGIGRAVVEALLDHGWTVRFLARSVDEAQAALRPAHGERVAGRAVDVRLQREVDAAVAWVEATDGRLDLLVCNAGIGLFRPLDEITGDEWRQLIATNLSGPFYAMRAAVPLLERSGDGWIVAIGSIAARHAFAGGAAYNASKFGLLGLAEAAMLDLRHRGIRVTSILPGSVDTGFGSGGSADAAAWKLAPEDVARTLVDLLAFPRRALPSRVEIRPTEPPRRA